MNNVFRYDVDNDGAITYEEFVIFFIILRLISAWNSISERWLFRDYIKLVFILGENRE